MSYPPTLKDSLGHVAIIGKYRWAPGSTESQRRIALEPGIGFDDAVGKIGFELAFGPNTQRIDGRPFDSFAVAPPRMVETIWGRSEDYKNVRSIALDDQKPLLDALKSGNSAREIGGKLFRQLLDDLDALRPFWNPDFDYHLTIAAYLSSNRNFESRGRRPIPGRLKRAFFQPNVNTRLLAALRGPKEGLEDNLQAFVAAFEGILAKDGLGGEDAHAIALDAAGDLKALYGALGGDVPLPKELEGFTDHGEPDERLPLDLGKQWRALRGHLENVRKVIDCEPLFALMIEWFFGKIAGDGDVAKNLYEHVYTDHRDKAILGQAQRDEDQVTAERVLDERLRATLGTLKIGEDDERGQLLRAYAQSIIDHVKGVMAVKRNPKSTFDREDLLTWLRQQFAALLPYGMDAGEKIMAELGGLADRMLTAYEKLGGIYGDDLTAEALRKAAPEPGAEGYEVWIASCDAAVGLAGQALADKFRSEFNSRMSESIAARFAEWFRSEIGDEEHPGLAAKIEAITGQYMRQVGFLATAEGSLASLAGSSGAGALRRDRQQDAKPGLTDKASVLDKPIAKTLRATAGSEPAGGGGAEPPAQVQAAPQAGADPASGAGAGSAAGSGDPSAPAGDPPPAGPTRFTEIMWGGLDRGAPDAALFDASRESLEEARRRIVERLSSADGALARARGDWRGLALGEAALGAGPGKSALGRNHSSLGPFLLLEMASHVGAIPGRESRAHRDALERVDQDLTAGVTKVPMWEIYQVPRDKDEALETLQAVVAYWRGIARAVMSCRDYAKDVGEVRTFLGEALPKGVRVTFYNETLAEHCGPASRPSANSLCFASNVLPDPNRADSVSPPSYVWVTQQGAAKDGMDGALQAFNTRFDAEVAAFQPNGGVIMLSYPLIASERRVGGPSKGLALAETELESWSSETLLLVLLGALSPARSRVRLTHGGREVEVGRYYEETVLAKKVAPVVLQTRVLTAAFFFPPDSNRLGRALREVSQSPQAGIFKTNLSLLRGGDTSTVWVDYDVNDPPPVGARLGWLKMPLTPDLIEAARAGGLAV